MISNLLPCAHRHDLPLAFRVAEAYADASSRATELAIRAPFDSRRYQIAQVHKIRLLDMLGRVTMEVRRAA